MFARRVRYTDFRTFHQLPPPAGAELPTQYRCRRPLSHAIDFLSAASDHTVVSYDLRGLSCFQELRHRTILLIWFCLAVVFASIGYIVVIAKTYTDYVHATQPYIEETTKNNESLEGEIEAEKEVNQTIISQAKEEAIVISDLKIAVEKVEEEIAKEKATEEKLELAKQMKQFTKRKP
jgi:cell division protein FtsB